MRFWLPVGEMLPTLGSVGAADGVSFSVWNAMGRRRMNDDEQFEGHSEATELDAPVIVTVLHGGFDRASYALIVPVYAHEEMSGAERFLDRQFGQLLGEWRDLGRYPGALGTSVFVEPDVDVKDCEPPGAHLVGVGSSLTLDRRRLRFAVRRALIDRCLRLYPPVRLDLGASATDQQNPATTLVGVSSALLGVRDDESLRVEDSVAGILEAVHDTNRGLERFEQDLGTACRVRIRYIEFVERYADRANLAASAIRHMRAAGQVATGFEGLADVVVKSEDGDGALPIGASLLEQDRPWRRFLITERQTNDPPAADASSRPLVVEVSALGREARADRVTHRIDRASLDALMTRVSNNRTNQTALEALRDRLVPYQLRAEFLTTAAIQIGVDASTANYPWELLTGTAVSRQGGEPTGTASVLRMFTEGSDRRLHVERATVDTALVIGAGNVDLEGLPPIPGAVDEAVAVSRLLTAKGIETETMVDTDGPLDVADLNIALCGDHQVLHIASHGIHVDGDRDATGAVLAKNLRFTEDLIESLPRVPELVVVNSCYNARVGPKPGDQAFQAGAATPRMAAGLARALMGIGVRAVVAAGWPVNDTAAMVFAVTLHEQLTAGHTYGEAVARARAACADLSGTSWAAYQCYGDPTFVLRGRPHEPTLTSVPVSLSDLKGRLGALRTRAADISRPKASTGPAKPGTSGERRELLRKTFDQLSTWVTQTAYPTKQPAQLPPEVRRELAMTARELADFTAAAEWYRTFAVVPADGKPARPTEPHASAFDLQQAANCLARSAQKEAGLGRVAEALALFPEAEALAKGAIELLPQDEAWSILASVYKKWATVEPEPAQRDARVAAAVDAYEHLSSNKPGDYGVENRIQFLAIRDLDRANEVNESVHREVTGNSEGAQQVAKAPLHVVDAAPPRTTTFWERAAAADYELSRLMVADTEEKRAAAARRMVRKYADAFRRRSTYSERFSSWDHLKDLGDVLSQDDPRKPLLENARVELEDLMGVAPADPSNPAGESPVGDETAGGRRTQRGDASVELKAFPARSGECLLLEYTGNDRAKHRILVDGGLGSAFDDGVGTVLAPVGSVTRVDVAVVTHVDRDHLEGVLRALEDKRLDADDFWFNGRSQIADQGRGHDARSIQQGDALSKLIPDDRRNLVVEGRALLVPGSRPLRIPLPGGATAVLLSPSEKRLHALLKKWPQSRGDPGSIDELMNALRDEAVRGPGEFGKDHSTANGSSIAFLFEHDGASILFTADALASELESSIRALLTERGQARLKVQLLKLPHHGSRQNITDELLDLIDPEQILVCTDGSQFSHPDEDALEKVRSAYPNVPIHFTDSTDLIRKRAHHVDMQAPSSTPVVIAL